MEEGVPKCVAESVCECCIESGRKKDFLCGRGGT